MGSRWNCTQNCLPKHNTHVEVKMGNTIKRMVFTAGMKGDDLRFTHWRYIDGGYDYKPKALWLPDYGKIER